MSSYRICRNHHGYEMKGSGPERCTQWTMEDKKPCVFNPRPKPKPPKDLRAGVKRLAKEAERLLVSTDAFLSQYRATDEEMGRWHDMVHDLRKLHRLLQDAQL